MRTNALSQWRIRKDREPAARLQATAPWVISRCFAGTWEGMFRTATHPEAIRAVDDVHRASSRSITPQQRQEAWQRVFRLWVVEQADRLDSE